MGTTRHITLPAGFVAAGVKCGIKSSGKEDLAVVVADRPVSAALMTTSNQVVGAPVMWCRKALPKGFGLIHGIVINAGCSNVCTGTRGQKDAAAMAELVAAAVGAKPAEVLVASTGIIGHHLPMDKVRRGIAAATAALDTEHDDQVIRAIMTTDTRAKTAVVQTRIGGQRVTVAGIVKGAGMIAPSMATMIAVITTDAKIAPPLLYAAFTPAVAASFNAVTVDSDQSTSDTAVIMASGLAGREIRMASADYGLFTAALNEVCQELARAMARDGEGATKLIEVRVRGARTDAEAALAAKSVANSPLFKCAVNGGDPNWGRILCALGKSAAKIDPDKTIVKLGPVTVFSRGQPTKFNLARAQAHLAGDTIIVEANLNLGKGHFTAYTCDFSREYVAINADYHT